jgi:hypothetical protein
MTQQHGQPPAGEPADTAETVRWAGHPFTGTLAEARVRVEEAAADWAALVGASWPAPEVIDAAVTVLAVPPDRRNASASADPAVVWDIDGGMVAVWRDGTQGGAVTGAWCACGDWDGPDSVCEHVLVALAGTEQHESEGSEAFADVASAIAVQFPELTLAERNRAVTSVLLDVASRIRDGNYMIVSRPDSTDRPVWDEDEFPRFMRASQDEKQPGD